MTDCLRRVRVENDAAFSQEATDFRDRLKRSEFVVRRHNRDEPRVRTQRRRNVRRRNNAVAVRAQVRNGDAATLQRAKRFLNGRVFKRRRNDVYLLDDNRRRGVVCRGDRVENPSVRLRRAGREDDFLRTRAKRFGDRRSRLFESLTRCNAVRMTARSVPETVAQKGKGSIEREFRKGRRRGGVDVNCWFHWRCFGIDDAV